jgi:outer membrane protein assembly factor BamB
MSAAQRICIAVVAAAGFVWASSDPASGRDWPQWRGPKRDGAIASFTPPGTWPEQLKQHWQVEVGLGYATPLLVGDRIYAFTRQGEEEVMTALDPANGGVIWRTPYPAPFQMTSATARHGPGPKSTPTYADGRLFTLGMSSIVSAFDAKTGRRLWQNPQPNAQPRFHTAMAPVVDGNRVIVHIGGPDDAALTAFDVATGEVRWRWTGDSPAYGSPVVVDLEGTRQVVTFTHRNLVGVDVATGKLLWSRPFKTPSDTTAQTPVLYRDTIIQAGRENGITAFRLVRDGDSWNTKDVWRVDEVSLHLANAVAVNGVLYGLSHLNSGQYFALDLDAGKVLWKTEPRQADNAAIVRAGDTIFSLEDDGELVVLKTSRTAFEPIRRYQVATSATWAQPAISGKRLLIKDVSKLTLWTLE